MFSDTEAVATSRELISRYRSCGDIQAAQILENKIEAEKEAKLENLRKLKTEEREYSFRTPRAIAFTIARIKDKFVSTHRYTR